VKTGYGGYESFSYLEAGRDYRAFDLDDTHERLEPWRVPLDDAGEARAEELASRCTVVSLHEHVGLFPDPIEETPAYVREGRMATAFRALAHSKLDAVFDNLMDGICQIESKSGWKWNDVLHDLGMRLCDLAHQDFLVPARRVDDILAAKASGRIAWMPSMEGAAMIENELDRIDLLFGFGVRCLGIAYSEANALGSGLKEPRDGGLTMFGRQAVERMNKVGMLIDCSHAGDVTTMDTIEVSEAPVVLTHIGARALWDTNRLAPDEVLEAIAGSGGVIGIEAAPHTTLTAGHPRHSLDSFMEHFEYVKGLVGVDHVGFGADTLYGDHVGLHRAYVASLSLQAAEGKGGAAADFPRVEYVEGLENPTEAWDNILRWLVAHGYGDDEIEKVLGGNVLRVLREVWA
jgi:membrane dipeptidase